MARAKAAGNHNNNNNNNNNSNHQNLNQCKNHNHGHQHEQQRQPAEEPTITDLDYKIAKYLKSKLPAKEAMFVGIKRVNYFVGSKAVDLLMESQWASQKDDAIFKDRNDVVIFLNDLLLKKFYHRSRKIIKMDGAKKKFKLDMHNVQVFEDSNEPYVWLYEPTSLTAWLLCFGAIFVGFAICLFPLWPPIIRTWVYYLCIAGLAFLSSILGLAVVRHIVFFTVWMLSFGKVQFWILPNLTEDVGFMESFWPLYAFEEGGGEISGGGGDGTGEPVAASSGSAGIKED